MERTLKELIRAFPELQVKGRKDLVLRGISSHSKMVAPGYLFVAHKLDFIEEAIKGGAIAVVSELFNPFLQITQLIHPKPKALEPFLAAKFYGSPAKELRMIGVTGTKGKTTTTYWIRHLLESVGERCGLIGTIETIAGDRKVRSQLTTHDVIYNQKWLHEMVSQGCTAAVLEVSSHGVDQKRIDQIPFQMGIFTNLFPDHLDYHQTMELYAAAKREFLHKAEISIVNQDSPWSDFMMKEKKAFTFGIQKKADLMGAHIQTSFLGTKVILTYLRQEILFSIPLLGEFNVYNLLASVSVGLQMGLSLDAMAQIFQKPISIPGRLEKIVNHRNLTIFVDFAHTEEALASVLQTLKNIAPGRVIVVFGAGGNRDPRRREGMGRAAAEFADLAIITSDNPRKEDPMMICHEIFLGFGAQSKKATIEIDRRKAIALAIQMMHSNDILLIAGKGHETTQEIQNQKLPFDDRIVIHEFLCAQK
jgi:UDP-N-acetylmuramoyl-L-alanyl-D-glutamate--2,6-diaminopimelate ligase